MGSGMGRINWDKLRELVEVEIPEDPEREYLSPGMKEWIKSRDAVCVICGRDKDLHVHHIIPGKSTEDNLITLCKFCHQVVHCLLYVTGRYGFADTLRGYSKRF